MASVVNTQNSERVPVDAFNVVRRGADLKRTLKSRDGFSKVMHPIDSGIYVDLSGFRHIIIPDGDITPIREFREGDEIPADIRNRPVRHFYLRNYYIVAQYEETN